MNASDYVSAHDFFMALMGSGFEDDTFEYYGRSLAIFELDNDLRNELFLAFRGECSDVGFHDYAIIDPHMTIDGVGNGGWELIFMNDKAFEEMKREEYKRRLEALTEQWERALEVLGRQYPYTSFDGSVSDVDDMEYMGTDPFATEEVEMQVGKILNSPVYANACLYADNTESDELSIYGTLYVNDNDQRAMAYDNARGRWDID